MTTHCLRDGGDAIPLPVLLVLSVAIFFAVCVFYAVDALLWLAGPGLRWTVSALVLLGVLAIAGVIP